MSDILVECRGVTVGYDEPILEDIDLTIERGEIVALLGGSGCGKSTLLRALTGLLRPLDGDVRLFGTSLYAQSIQGREKLLARTGTAFQQDALFGAMTVGDNIALPLRELTHVPDQIVREMVRMRLSLVGLDGYEDTMPNNLSGGQRKRAALARASILDPDVLFCDEPSAGLDPAVAAGIDETLLAFRKALGITIVVVTHELASLHAIADRAVMFAHGNIVAEGTVDQLAHSRDDDVYRFFHRVADLPQTIGASQGAPS
ncbi:MAG TPA: ATP-binding cassette domain-containing protein [Kofleriaceae bacterium]|jgi:phospholipid/cholesterol/gamma-HCH transport system ATP-binding protein